MLLRIQLAYYQVDYSMFKRNKPILRAGVKPVPIENNYGMVLVRKNTVDSETESA